MAKLGGSKDTGIASDIFSLPFKAVNLPFKGLRQYYGKPKGEEKYTGNFIQKKRLKKLVPLILNGEELKESDRLFMNMFNDFFTAEGNSPIDQEDVTLNCTDCEPYLYKKRYSSSVKKKNTDDDGDGNNTNPSTYRVEFQDELKPKNTNFIFKENGSYVLSFLGSKIKSGKTEFYFKNRSLAKDDYLIFKTNKTNNIISITSFFEVYQNNLKYPLRQPIFLGEINAKIY